MPEVTLSIFFMAPPKISAVVYYCLIAVKPVCGVLIAEIGFTRLQVTAVIHYLPRCLFVYNTL